jgi:hypothetical protein
VSEQGQSANPGTFSQLANFAGASIIGSRLGRVIAAIFFALQIYTFAALPVWEQTAGIREAWGKQQQVQAEANAAREKEAGRANAAAADATSKAAESHNAVMKAKADADRMENEADNAYAIAINSPAKQKAMRDASVAEASLLVETATAARDQAKATAEKMENEAALAQTKADTEGQVVAAKISGLKNKADAGTSAILFHIGPPLPPSLSFESDK